MREGGPKAPKPGPPAFLCKLLPAGVYHRPAVGLFPCTNYSGVTLNGTLTAARNLQQSAYAKRVEAFGLAALLAPYRRPVRIPVQRVSVVATGAESAAA